MTDEGSSPPGRRTVWWVAGAVVLVAVVVGGFLVSQRDDGSDRSAGTTSGVGGGTSSTTVTEPAGTTTGDPATETTGDGSVLSSCPPPAQPEPAPTGPDELVFRPVLATAPPGVCEDAPGWLEDGEGSSYQLGPAAAAGVVESAEAKIDTVNGDWVVVLTLKEGRPGIDDFNDLAAACSATGPACPTGQVAAVLGDEVVTAPTIQAPAFERDEIQISAAFSKDEAEELADRIG